MGSTCSPEICDIAAYELIKQFFNMFPENHKISFYGKYRDYGFSVYNGPQNEIESFFNIENSIHPLQNLHSIYQIQRQYSKILVCTKANGSN